MNEQLMSCWRTARSMRALMATIIALSGLPSATWSGESGEIFERFHALCVGLTYPDSHRPLSRAAPDVEAMAKALHRASGLDAANCHVAALVQPTPELLRQRLNAIADAAGASDRIVIYFVGRGVLLDERHTALGLSENGDFSQPSGRLPLSEVKEILAGSMALRALVILDVDELDVEALARDMTLDETGAGLHVGNIAWLTAADTGERSWMDEAVGDGLFTRYLLEALGPMAEMADQQLDDLLSVEEIRAYIQDGIAAHIHAQLLKRDMRWKDRRQHPRVGLGGRADAKALERWNMFAVPPRTEMMMDCGNGVIMKFVLIPARTFMMGSPETEGNHKAIYREAEDTPGEEIGGRNDGEIYHQVTISKSFFMGIYPVTQAQYYAVMKVNPSFFPGNDRPVENVRWVDAINFCRHLSAKTKKTVRLPTEAEWEYACRAGTSTPFYFGETISTDQANYNGYSVYGDGTQGINRKETTPVGKFAANSWGLFDMHGNVWEWCADWLGEYPSSPAVDPQSDGYFRRGDQSYHSENRVLRGGSWDSAPKSLRSANRSGLTPRHYRYPFDVDGNLGFRVVLR